MNDYSNEKSESDFDQVLSNLVEPAWMLEVLIINGNYCEVWRLLKQNYCTTPNKLVIFFVVNFHRNVKQHETTSSPPPTPPTQKLFCFLACEQARFDCGCVVVVVFGRQLIIHT